MIVHHLIDKWNYRLQRMPELSHQVYPGNTRSYPIFGENVIRFFYYPADQVGVDTLYIAPPHTIAVVSLEDFSLVSESDNDLPVEPFEPVEYEVSLEMRQANRAYIMELKLLYDMLAVDYPDHAERNAVGRFWEVLAALVPPVLFPHYQALAPEFQTWTNS